MAQPIDLSICGAHPLTSSDLEDADAGMASFGQTMFNAEGDDDDCKYHVAWTSTPVSTGAEVTFTLSVTLMTDGKPLQGAPIRAEAFLSDTHLAPSAHQTATEGSPGVYQVGPVRFDASGRWTVRFHFFEDCADSPETSPHAHAAFFVEVP